MMSHTPKSPLSSVKIWCMQRMQIKRPLNVKDLALMSIYVLFTNIYNILKVLHYNSI
jgi:hypothetical protein